MNQISIKRVKHGSVEWGDANVTCSNDICSNRISTNYYGINGGMKNGKNFNVYHVTLC